MGLLNQLKSLFSPSVSSDSADGQAEQPAMITVYDKLGRQFEIARDQWRSEILPDQLAQTNDDPEALYSAIVGALNDAFYSDLLGATARLLEIDNNRERAHAARAIVLMKTGDLDGAERILNDYLDKIGPSGTILTNLAKVQSERGQEAQAEATLWLGLTHDPNQDNGLLWYCSLQQDKRGDEGLWDAMRRAAQIAGSWRPQLWLARRALDQKNPAEARGFYAHVIRSAVDDPEVLMMISGDLGNHGYIAELIEIVAPVYDAARHDPRAGMNLLHAYLQTGQVRQGEELLHELFALARPDLRDHLFHYSNEFGKLKEPASDEMPAEGPVECELVAIDRPIWAQGLHDPRWLFASGEKREEEIVFLPLANITETDKTDPYVQREDELGRLTRSVALYLSEAVFFWTPYRAKTVMPVVRGGGPIVSGAAWPEEHVLDFAGEARYAVSGTIDETISRVRIELVLWDCSGREPIGRFSCESRANEVGAGVLELEQQLLAALPGRAHTSPGESFYERPDAGAIDRYLLGLSQSLTLSMVQGGIIRRDAIWGERNIFQTCLDLVLAMPEAQVPRILFLSALLKAHEYGSLVYSEFKPQALELLDEAQDPATPLYRLSPLLLKPFDMHRFRTRRAELLKTATGAYRLWLESLSEA